MNRHDSKDYLLPRGSLGVIQKWEFKHPSKRTHLSAPLHRFEPSLLRVMHKRCFTPKEMLNILRIQYSKTVHLLIHDRTKDAQIIWRPVYILYSGVCALVCSCVCMVCIWFVCMVCMAARGHFQSWCNWYTNMILLSVFFAISFYLKVETAHVDWIPPSPDLNSHESVKH